MSDAAGRSSRFEQSAIIQPETIERESTISCSPSLLSSSSVRFECSSSNELFISHFSRRVAKLCKTQIDIVRISRNNWKHQTFRSCGCSNALRFKLMQFTAGLVGWREWDMLMFPGWQFSMNSAIQYGQSTCFGLCITEERLAWIISVPLLWLTSTNKKTRSNSSTQIQGFIRHWKHYTPKKVVTYSDVSYSKDQWDHSSNRSMIKSSTYYHSDS